MSRVWTLWTLGSKGQRSRSQCKDYWKWFLAHNCFPFTPIFMKLHMQSPHESSMCPMEFRVKRSKVKDYWKRLLAHNCFLFTMQGLLKKFWCITGWNFTCSLPMSRVWTLWTLGSKGQRSRLQCKDYYTLSSWNFTCSLPMSRVWTLWTLGSKGQRSRSQCKDYWKRFLAHNCFPYLVHNLESLNWLPRGVFCPVRTAPF